MILFSYEEDKKLTTQERYDILDFSVQAAEDNGFINTFIFSRAIYLFAAIVLLPERKDEIAGLVAESITTAWDALIADGTIQDLHKNYKQDLDYLADEGQVWIEDFTAYLHSARGLLNTLQDFSGTIVQQAAEALQKNADSAGVSQVLEIADNWGMNNKPLPTPKEEVEAESLFEE